MGNQVVLVEEVLHRGKENVTIGRGSIVYDSLVDLIYDNSNYQKAIKFIIENLENDIKKYEESVKLLQSAYEEEKAHGEGGITSPTYAELYNHKIVLSSYRRSLYEIKSILSNYGVVL